MISLVLSVLELSGGQEEMRSCRVYLEGTRKSGFSYAESVERYCGGKVLGDFPLLGR